MTKHDEKTSASIASDAGYIVSKTDAMIEEIEAMRDRMHMTIAAHVEYLKICKQVAASALTQAPDQTDKALDIAEGEQK